MSSAELANSYQPKTLFQKLKRAGAELIGRDRANLISGPLYDWLAQRETQKRLRALPARDLRINLGCGYRPLAGWTNVDIARGPQVDIVWDLRTPLPFRDESCRAIFSEHVIEHLSKDDGERLLRECYRALQPGGVLRISTPDAERYLCSYAGDSEFLRHPAFTEPIETPLDRINQMMRERGQHLWVYDAQSLRLSLHQAGFPSVAQRSFGQSSHPMMQGIDCESREFESLYVEAVKGQ
jgi:predicted SAM-dependent methyltransferase